MRNEDIIVFDVFFPLFLKTNIEQNNKGYEDVLTYARRQAVNNQWFKR